MATLVERGMIEDQMDGKACVIFWLNETKTAALEVVKTKVNGLILIVDHATEIKEGFESVISIEFDGKNSRATQ